MKHLSMKSVCLAAFLSILMVPFAQGAESQAAPPQTAYTITAKAKGVDLKAVSAKLEADTAFKEGQCSALKGGKGKAARLSYTCAKPSEKTDAAFRAAAGTGTSLVSTTAGCAAGCTMAYCPYPFLQCCNNLTHTPCQ
jgi:hypothetical protein